MTVDLLRAKGEEVIILDDLIAAPFLRGQRRAFLPWSRRRPRPGGTHRDGTQDRSVRAFCSFAYVRESVLEPALYFENNVVQGIGLMEALRQNGVQLVVFSSSCATYGESDQVPISEKCRQWPSSPYGWSKLSLERVLDSYCRAYGLKFVVLRYFNAAGATERHGEYHKPESHLIPNVLSVALG